MIDLNNEQKCWWKYKSCCHWKLRSRVNTFACLGNSLAVPIFRPSLALTKRSQVLVKHARDPRHDLRGAAAPVDHAHAPSRLVQRQNHSHRASLKKISPGFPRPDPIRRATYIRLRCHHGSYRHDGRRCRTSGRRARPPVIVPGWVRTRLKPFLRGFFFHNRDVSVGLIGYHFRLRSVPRA
jgi:hypothetical protein